MNCKNLKILKEVLNLNDVDVEILSQLIENPNVCVDLKEKIKKDNSTISRALNKLHSMNLIRKEAKCCESKKGRYFLYSFVGSKYAKQAIKKAIKAEYNSKKEKIELIFE